VKHGDKGLLATALGVTPRTLRNWKLHPPSERGPGRTPHAPRLRRKARRLVGRAWKAQGKRAGWRTIQAVLGQALPTALVQESLKAWKAHARRKEERRRQARRVHVKVHATDALWSTDATHLGRLDGQLLEGRVVKEVATTKTVALAVGPPTTAADQIALLKEAARQRGTWPLVLALDNGSANRAHATQRLLAEQRVVPLYNVPRTPQHNAWAERGIRELKEESGLDEGLGVLAAGPRCGPARSFEEAASECAARLQHARAHLDHVRVRTSRGGRTADAVDAQMPAWYRGVDREVFHAAACRAIHKAVEGCNNPRARRRAEREAILQTLETFGLITRTRGGLPLPGSKRKEFSDHHRSERSKPMLRSGRRRTERTLAR